ARPCRGGAKRVEAADEGLRPAKCRHLPVFCLDHHQAPGTTCLTTFMRSGPAIGLTSQPVAPSFLPSPRFSALLSVVRVRIGVNLKAGMPLRFLISSRPPIL